MDFASIWLIWKLFLSYFTQNFGTGPRTGPRSFTTKKSQDRSSQKSRTTNSLLILGMCVTRDYIGCDTKIRE